MGTTNERRFKMVVAVDDSELADVVLDRAFDEAGRHEAPDLHILRVHEAAGGFFRRDRDDPELGDARAALSAQVARKLEDFERGPAAVWRVRLHVRHGRPAEEIANLAAEAEADLVVLGRFGLQAKKRRRALGSVADEVLRLASAPVLVVQIADYGEKEAGVAQCEQCVAVREGTDGERWFCPEHQGGYLGTSTLLMPHSDTLLGQGLMW